MAREDRTAECQELQAGYVLQRRPDWRDPRRAGIVNAGTFVMCAVVRVRRGASAKLNGDDPTKVPYDTEGVPHPRSRPQRRKGAETPVEQVEAKPGSFADRIVSRRVDLIDLIDNGLPPLDFLPASDEMLVRGKRHALAAPYKTGKSISVFVHFVDMALAGARVVIFDRENGGDLQARRLADIMEARRLTSSQRRQLQRNLDYHAFPLMRLGDGDELADYCREADLVVFDSQRMFLSNLGLKEDASDDYAKFMDALVDPLFRARIATLLLDNTGHGNKTRGRGTSSKGDLNEVLFSLAAEEEFDLYTTGSVRLKVEHSRFGTVGEWTMRIGGGVYEPWQSDAATEKGAVADEEIDRKILELVDIGEHSKNQVNQLVPGRRSRVNARVKHLLASGQLVVREVDRLNTRRQIRKVEVLRRGPTNAD